MRTIEDEFKLVRCDCGCLYEYDDADIRHFTAWTFVACPKCQTQCFLLPEMKIKPAKPRIIVEGEENEIKNNKET